MHSAWEEKFKNPGSEYRGLPFWSWNGHMEPTLICKQIEDFHTMKLGGFFMHSRMGLETPYLSDEWFTCIKVAIQKAAELDMRACLYDEDRWASGTAGGFVTCHEEFRGQFLYLRKISSLRDYVPHPERLGLWSTRHSQNNGQNFRKISSLTQVGSDEILWEAFVEKQQPEPRYNQTSYIDVLNPDAVRFFIDTTYQRYYEELGSDFGSRFVPMIFTDEPHYLRYGAEKIFPMPYSDVHVCAWNKHLPKLFFEACGLTLTDHLPELFFQTNAQDAGLIRYYFFKVLTELFVTSYTKQIYEWCEAHHIAFTGHMLWEDMPATQSRSVGDSMRHYQYMHIPGMDQLTEYSQLYNTCKQVASVARQTGRRFRISEVYGCTGWDTTLTAYKAMADWQFVLGINQRCLHLSFYSMKGEAKRDYPASFTAHSNQMKALPLLEDYFARLSVILSEGEEIRQLLVINPVESAWILLDSQLKTAEEFDRKTNALCNELLANALDFDYGNEEMLSKSAQIIHQDGNTVLRLGKATYRAILLPEMQTIRRTTLELLTRFYRAGGIIAHLGSIPSRIDGFPSHDANRFYEKLPCGISAIETVSRTIQFGTPQNDLPVTLLYQLRLLNNDLSLVVCNTSHDIRNGSHPRCQERRIEYPVLLVDIFTERSGYWYELFPEDGREQPCIFEKRTGGYRITTSFKPLQTRIFIQKKFKLDIPRFTLLPVEERFLSPSEIPIGLTLPNSLILDHATWESGGETGYDFILTIDDLIRKKLGVPIRTGNMIQPWANANQEDHCTPLRLTFEFEIAELPCDNLCVALENPQLWNLFLNDLPLQKKDCGIWIDRAIRKLELPKSLLKSGKNKLCLMGDYHSASSGLEALYLLGDFGIKQDCLVRPPTTLKLGDWVAQGLPYYAGDVRYRYEFEAHTDSAIVKLGAFAGTALRIFLNGQLQSILGWEPFESKLSALQSGKNILEIEVIGSRRNLFGPFFLNNPHPPRFGAYEFREHAHPNKRDLTPYGLYEPPKLLFYSTKK